VAAASLLVLAHTSPALSLHEAITTNQATDACAGCHQKLGDKIASLYLMSTHSASAIGCYRCHGGDPFADDKQKAHGERFVGRPSVLQVVEMCGSCHKSQLSIYKSGRHFQDKRGKPRVDCVQCHGAHTVGAPAESFRFAFMCSDCHGLEYLPELPEDFRKLLSVADESAERVRAAAKSGRAVPDHALSLRREIRRKIAELVHSTDLGGGLEKLPAILKLGEQFNKSLGQNQK
jgi:cytochrome c3-like protein